MGRIVDLDDLMDSDQTAAFCGLSSRNSLAANVGRKTGVYADFPEQVKPGYWHRHDLEAWDQRHPNRKRMGRRGNAGR